MSYLYIWLHGGLLLSPCQAWEYKFWKKAKTSNGPENIESGICKKVFFTNVATYNLQRRHWVGNLLQQLLVASSQLCFLLWPNLKEEIEEKIPPPPIFFSQTRQVPACWLALNWEHRNREHLHLTPTANCQLSYRVSAITASLFRVEECEWHSYQMSILLIFPCYVCIMQLTRERDTLSWTNLPGSCGKLVLSRPADGSSVPARWFPFDFRAMPISVVWCPFFWSDIENGNVLECRMKQDVSPHLMVAISSSLLPGHFSSSRSFAQYLVHKISRQRKEKVFLCKQYSERKGK